MQDCLRLTCKMERRIVTTHGPNHGDETHEHSDAIGEVGSDVKLAPHICIAIPLGQPLTAVRSIVADRNNNDDNEESDDIECTAGRVELCDPASGHGTDDSVNDHNDNC